jgi:hypothetical protein
MLKSFHALELSRVTEAFHERGLLKADLFEIARNVMKKQFLFLRRKLVLLGGFL